MCHDGEKIVWTKINQKKMHIISGTTCATASMVATFCMSADSFSIFGQPRIVGIYCCSTSEHPGLKFDGAGM